MAKSPLDDLIGNLERGTKEGEKRGESPSALTESRSVVREGVKRYLLAHRPAQVAINPRFPEIGEVPEKPILRIDQPMGDLLALVSAPGIQAIAERIELSVAISFTLGATLHPEIEKMRQKQSNRSDSQVLLEPVEPGIVSFGARIDLPTLQILMNEPAIQSLGLEKISFPLPNERKESKIIAPATNLSTIFPWLMILLSDTEIPAELAHIELLISVDVDSDIYLKESFVEGSLAQTLRARAISFDSHPETPSMPTLTVMTKLTLAELKNTVIEDERVQAIRLYDQTATT